MTDAADNTGTFAQFDITRVTSPAFVVDEATIEYNLQILNDIHQRSGAYILSALKAFAMFDLAPLIAKYLNGVCASGIYEARLGREEYKGIVSTYCAGYKEKDMDEIITLSDHVIFNSLSQKEKFAHRCHDTNKDGQKRAQTGLRINPEHSEVKTLKYDPSAHCSRLGIPISQLTADMVENIDGLHIHNLCEQDFAPLMRTWHAVEDKLSPYLERLKWLNLGGGHHITKHDYDREGLIDLIRTIQNKYDLRIYLEPGEAVAFNAGILVGEVLDLPENGIQLAIVDVSATCHMPDVLEAPYRPDVMNESTTGYDYRLGGPSCLAGDIIGDYTFSQPLQVGQRLAFLNQAHYSMVKTNTFNGIPLPAIFIWNSKTDQIRLIKSFSYHDFKNRLS